MEKLSRAKMATRKLASEKKIVSFPLLPHRQSISERKPIPGIDRVASRVPRPNGARKGLDFDDKPKATGSKFYSIFSYTVITNGRNPLKNHLNST